MPCWLLKMVEVPFLAASTLSVGTVPGSEEKHAVIDTSWALLGEQGPRWPLFWLCVMDSNVSCKVQEYPRWYKNGVKCYLLPCEDLMTCWVVPCSRTVKPFLQSLLLRIPLVESWRSLPPEAKRTWHCSHCSEHTSTVLCKSNKPVNLFKCCYPVKTRTFLLRHSLDCDFSIDVWPDLSVSNMTANKSSAHWADPIWPDRDKMTGAG